MKYILKTGIWRLWIDEIEEFNFRRPRKAS
jgi:hypothetical protein